MHSFTRRGFLCATLATPLLAGDNWNDRKVSDWTDKDIRKLLTKSPWAKEVALEMGMEGGGPPDAPPDGGGGGGGGPHMVATVLWESALPIRLARKKEPAGTGQYVLSLSGLPMLQERGAQRMLDSLTETAELVRKGKDSLHAFSAKIEEGNTRRVVFTFDAGSEPIQMSDREVAFRVQEGPMLILARFQMREMMYQGKLEL